MDPPSLYPKTEAYQTHRLAVDSPHNLYIEESGNPNGIPAVFLHGGPGAGVESYHRQLFDPKRYRIVLFDQRGCGKSTPHAELEGNTTQALIDDMESIRKHLGIQKWLVFGGSWGSTLGLAYAQTHPQQVLGMVLRGIFLCRPKEIHWFYQDGASKIFPDYWQDYLKPIPEDERGDLVSAFYQQLTSDDKATRDAAAQAWSVWEGRTATLMGRQEVVNHFSDPHIAVSLARIECHYFKNNSFLDENQLLRNVSRLREIPGVIIHGRYDMVCPIENAWELHQAWPEADFQIIDDAGHAASEPGILRALLAATNRFADQLCA